MCCKIIVKENREGGERENSIINILKGCSTWSTKRAIYSQRVRDTKYDQITNSI